jgi:diacylglycerol kinase
MLKFIISRLKAFGFAFKGLADLFLNHEPIWIHLAAIFFALSTAWVLDFPAWKWAMFVICIGFTITTESLNTAIEYVVDLVSPEYHELAGKAKDVAAAGVLVSAVTALVVYLILVWEGL